MYITPFVTSVFFLYVSKNTSIGILTDKRMLQFASGIKVRKGKVWSLTSRLQNYINGHVPVNETNYRVVMGDVGQLTRGTKCYILDNATSSSHSHASVVTQNPYNKPSNYKPFIFQSR